MDAIMNINICLEQHLRVVGYIRYIYVDGVEGLVKIDNAK
jgi:hypothetical protein